MPTTIETGLLDKITNLTTLDYTKLDFQSIKDGIVQFIKDNYSDTQNDFFESNGAVMLIDTLSYINSILAFRTDFLANEAYLPTAATQKAILNLLSLINYTPRGLAAAIGNASITLVNADDSLLVGNTLNRDFVISDPRVQPLAISVTDVAGNTMTFELFKSASDQVSQVIIPSGTAIGSTSGNGEVTIVEGRTVSQNFQVPLDVPSNLEVVLNYANALEGSINLTVNNQQYNRTPNFAFENGPTLTYELRYEQTNRYLVVFGDGIFGAKPPASGAGIATYRVGGGVVGNTAKGTINSTVSITDPATGQSITILIQNTTATTGGKERENLEFSKFYAPRQYATQLRAVTGQDYTVMGLGYQDGTNGSISKCISALRPYLAIYGSAAGPYNVIDGVNNKIRIKTKTATRDVTLSSGTNLTLQNVIDDFNSKALDLFPTENDVEFYAFSYPSSSYRIRGTVGVTNIDDTVSVTSTNRNFVIIYAGIPYPVLLPIGNLTYTQIVSYINAAIDTGVNEHWAKFIAETVYSDGKYYVEIHLTTDYIPSATNLFSIASSPSTNMNTTLGFTTVANPSVQYSLSKFAIGLKYHTPDAYFETLTATNNAYTLLGLAETRALPMAANYVDMYVLADGVNGIPTIASTSLKLALRNFINRYKVLTDRITVWDGEIKYIQLRVSIKVNSSYVLATVVDNVKAALTTFMNGSTNSFGDAFYISRIYDTLDTVAGIDHSDIVDIKEDGISQLSTGSGLFRNITTNFNEMWLGDEIIIDAEYVS